MHAGDRAGALEAVDTALALDPNFLAAHALRDRIVALANGGASTPAVVPESDTARPLVSPEGLARFEQRARRRRVDRRVDAARAAIANGRVREAAAAVDEIRDLDPNLPELRELTVSLAALGVPIRSHRVGPWLAAAAAFGGVMLAASWVQEAGGVGSRAMVAISSRVAAPARPTLAVEPPPPEPSSSMETTATSGELPLSRLTLPEPPRPQLSAPAKTPSEVAVRPAAYAETPPVQMPGLLAPVNDPMPTAPAPVAVATATSFSPVPLASVAAAIPTPAPPAAATAPTPVVPTPSDESLVHQTLQRYRRAYEGLDAQSARAVWPAVNEVALARAFDGLQSQTLTFDACDVTLHGDAAAAVCRGSARYVPKIGSHEPRIEPRTWNFMLRKSGATWTIESAKAAR